ncbi:MAG TPA: TetR/AcrR family transcriptional regulator [Elusimicrobiota bacterium]|nr:TetR/AcrR family transcriptional regulator [Elusimicrobiota bacterium]
MNIIVDKDKSNTLLPKIMRASIHLFVRQGIHGTTTKDIAREAGVAEGALYRHFKSKDELAWHIFQVHLDQFTAELMGKVMMLKHARERVRAYVAESFAAYDSDPELFTYLILQEHSELDKYARKYKHPGHVALRLIEDGQSSGEIRAGDRKILASLFVGSVIRVCVIKMYGEFPGELAKRSDEVADGVWRMLSVTADNP